MRVLAVDPAAPDPAAGAASGIAQFGNEALDVFGALVTNEWVLALFAAGIALAFAARVIGRAAVRLARPMDDTRPVGGDHYGGDDYVVEYDGDRVFRLFDSKSGRWVWFDGDGYSAEVNSYADELRVDDGAKRFTSGSREQRRALFNE